MLHIKLRDRIFNKQSKKTLSMIMVLGMLVAMVSMVSALDSHDNPFGEPMNPAPYDVSFAKTENDFVPTLYQGNFNSSISGLNHLKEDYGQNGFQLGGNDNPKRFDFYPVTDDHSIKFSLWLDQDAFGSVVIYEWQAQNMDVHYMITKGGNYFFVYTYMGEVSQDRFLMNPRVG